MSSSDEKDDGGGGGPSSSGESEVKIKDEPEPEDSANAALMEVDGSPPPAFGPAALGLHAVGTKFSEKMTPTKPTQVLNARGMPARIRKKNKMFFDDELLINDRIPPKGSPARERPQLEPEQHFGDFIATEGSGDTGEDFDPKKVLSRLDRMKDSMKKCKVDPDECSSLRVINPIALLDKKASQRIGLRLRNLLKLPKTHKFVSYEWFNSNIDRALCEGENDFQMCLREIYPNLTTTFDEVFRHILQDIRLPSKFIFKF